MVEKLICSSCKTRVANMTGSTRFQCPQCSKYEIVRCVQCRKIAAEYSCPGCGFAGPN